jgi:DNA polymerase I-like protein with 3'-5' exonuclease and polymerase domains
MQLPFPQFLPESNWKCPTFDELPSWQDAKRIAIDCETHDPHLTDLGPGVRRGGYICGVSFAIEDGPSYYLPVRHLENNLDPYKVFSYFQDQAKVFKGDITGANLPYDLDYLEEERVSFKPRFFRDIQVAQPLLNEHMRSYSMQAISEHWRVPGKDESLLEQAAAYYNVGPKTGMAKLPARFVGPYAEQDVRLPLTLLRKQEKALEEEGLWDIYDLESKITPILVKMRRRGVPIDQKHMEKVEQMSIDEEAKCLAEIKHITGIDIGLGNLMKADLVARALSQQGLHIPRTPKTQKPSIKKEWLESHKDNKVCKLIQRGRKWGKLRTTFVESIRRYQTNGRIHCTINQLKRTKDDGDTVGTITGRCSATDPNMQQQLARDPELGPLWRSVFIPEEGEEWACLDYSQQEPRHIVHFASLCGLPGADDAVEEYKNNPDMDYHQFMADITGLRRRTAKDLFLGLCYEMGGGLMCDKYLHLPTTQVPRKDGNGFYSKAGPEGQKILDLVAEKVPFAKLLSQMCIDSAKRKGYIKTIAGRHCRFVRLANGKYDFIYKAGNKLIQGSSADQLKVAMIALDEAGYDYSLVVHDEIDNSIPNRKVAFEMAEIMKECLPMRTPSKVDVEIGPNWGNVKKCQNA